MLLIVGEVRVLFVKVSVPASVAKVPVVGNVIFVSAIAVNVVVNAPEVARVDPSTKVKVALVVGAVMVTLLIVLNKAVF